MERYIGIDVHAASCTIAVISQSGRKLKDFPVVRNAIPHDSCKPSGRDLSKQIPVRCPHRFAAAHLASLPLRLTHQLRGTRESSDRHELPSFAD